VRDPRERLRDVLEAIERIERYVARGREAFESDELVQSWFVRHLQIIGEAARALPPEVRDRAPDIPTCAGRGRLRDHRYQVQHGRELRDAG
jgi:uncharacterized protein with HEPN domain